MCILSVYGILKGKQKTFDKKQLELAKEMTEYLEEINDMFAEYKKHFEQANQVYLKDNNPKTFQQLKECKRKYLIIVEITKVLTKNIEELITYNNCKKAKRELNTLAKTPSQLEELIDELDKITKKGELQS